MSAEDDGVESIKNPLEDVTAGLLDSSGQQLPLQAVHVKCKLMDLLSQVKKKKNLNLPGCLYMSNSFSCMEIMHQPPKMHQTTGLNLLLIAEFTC